MEGDEERQAGRRRGCSVGLQSKAPIFNLNRPRYDGGLEGDFFPLVFSFLVADIAEQSQSISDPELY